MHKVPQVSYDSSEPDDTVLIWRKNARGASHRGMGGPYTVSGVACEKRLVSVMNDREPNPNPFGFAQVKRYHTVEEYASSYFSDVTTFFQRYQSDEDLPEICILWR